MIPYIRKIATSSKTFVDRMLLPLCAVMTEWQVIGGNMEKESPFINM